MKTITIRMKDNATKTVNAHIVGDFAIHKAYDGKGAPYVITDTATGMKAGAETYATLKAAKDEGVKKAAAVINDYKARKPEMYADYVKAFNKLTGKTSKESEDKKMATKASKASKKVNTKATKESEGKKMAKTTKTTGASKKGNAKKDTTADVIARLERENAELKARLKSLEEPEIKGIDAFDVEGYLATRDNTARITAELIKAIEETDGLSIEWHGKGGKVVKKFTGTEWLYIRGASVEDTKSRKEIFKAMGFTFSGKEKTWFIAPHPLRNGKAWAEKKAKRASVNA